MGDLAETFGHIDEKTVRDYVTSGRQEDLHLDFKQVNDPAMDRDDRKSLALALSGFANSDGGIVVWGVEASKEQTTGVDCAIAEVPISNLDLFLSRLQSLTGEAAAPLVEGVLHEAIDMGDGSGFAKTLVPPSDAGPHMARSGEGRYFKRSGDSFYRMEHFDVEDMFGRRRKPSLRLVARASISEWTQTPHYKQFTLLIYLSIVNEGRGSARAPYLSVEVAAPYSVHSWGIDGNRNFGLPQLRSYRGARAISCGASSDFVIHPDTSIDVTAVSTKVIEPDDGQRKVPELTVKYKLAADDVATREETLTIDSEVILEQIGSA
jgi:hypothetical protein